MALRAGYKGIKKTGNGLKLSTDGELSLTGSGEAGELSELTDVNITDVADGDILIYDATSEKWKNAVPASAADKADITAIGTYETGDTASKNYAVGDHFYKNGKFCTAKVAIAQGATFTLNTNYVEGAIADSLNKSYSTDEQFTGKYWIDGKPIYQRTYNITTPSAATDGQTLLITANDITHIIKYEGVLWRSDGNDVMLPVECWKPSDSTVNHWIDIWFNRTGHNLQIGLGSSAALLSQTGYITLYYIKS